MKNIKKNLNPLINLIINGCVFRNTEHYREDLFDVIRLENTSAKYDKGHMFTFCPYNREIISIDISINKEDSPRLIKTLNLVTDNYIVLTVASIPRDKIDKRIVVNSYDCLLIDSIYTNYGNDIGFDKFYIRFRTTGKTEVMED